MKTFLLVLAFLIVGIGAKAQPYESIFGQNSTEWVFEWTNTPGSNQGPFIIEKDTLVGGISYKKLSFGHSPSIGIGLLREDINLGKVWYKGIRTDYHPTADTNERLSFDFTLQAGDSFDISNHIVGMAQGSYPPSWNLVDSVRVISGRKHIYFRGACDWAGPPPYEPLTFIEGIGCNAGPMFKHKGSTLLQSQYLLCSYKDSTRTFYSNSRYSGNCTLPTSINESLTNDAITVSPNPASDFLRVDYPTTRKLARLTLYNLSGQLVAEGTVSTLSVRGLPSGYYAVKIELEKRAPIYRRILIQ